MPTHRRGFWDSVFAAAFLKTIISFYFILFYLFFLGGASHVEVEMLRFKTPKNVLCLIPECLCHIYRAVKTALKEAQGLECRAVEHNAQPHGSFKQVHGKGLHTYISTKLEACSYKARWSRPRTVFPKIIFYYNLLLAPHRLASMKDPVQSMI